MTSTFASLEVRFSRSSEFLNELALAVKDGAVDYDIVRLAVVSQKGTYGDQSPQLFGTSDGNKPLHHTVKARWLEAGYTSRGQMVKLSALLGLVREGAELNDRWRATNTATSERELELVRQLEAGIKAHARLEIRTGGLHGEDPGWRAHEDIAAVADVAQACATCGQPIYFANDAFRHKNDFTDAYVGDGDEPVFGELVIKAGREEAHIQLPCRTCGGSKSILVDRRTERRERCPDCLTTNGKRLVLHHVADNAVAGRKV